MLGGQEWEVGVRGFWVFRPRTESFRAVERFFCSFPELSFLLEKP